MLLVRQTSNAQGRWTKKDFRCFVNYESCMNRINRANVHPTLSHQLSSNLIKRGATDQIIWTACYASVKDLSAARLVEPCDCRDEYEKRLDSGCRRTVLRPGKSGIKERPHSDADSRKVVARSGVMIGDMTSIGEYLSSVGGSDELSACEGTNGSGI